ncbi:nuclear transport factor 2 family protein [Mycobacterium spongiae]|uniref:SnoaL-like domain-containing protein n=1 Tax=Mycobacterium spongiae TaxID=886343 RepID=A0A975K2W5_9MYCO|nr:nuclear transport factor 2 family protein [Mycobacterium spongiae]QUR68933.1 hypothetical protein F6B93_19300 [Mycobacterium spongiae]
MDDYAQIMNLVPRFLMGVDHGNWDAVRTLMTDPFRADFSALTGEPATSATPGEFTRQWRKILSSYDASQHQIGNQIVDIDGENAEFNCYVTTSHFRVNGTEGGTLESIVGSYRFSLVRTGDGWKLSGVVFSISFQTSGSA